MTTPEIDEKALAVARRAVEDVLIDMRDRRISVLCGNGFVACEADGEPSSAIRLSTREGLRIGIRAYLAAAGGQQQ